MGETSRRRTGEFVRALTGLLMKNPDGLPARDAIRALEELVPPTDWERETFPSGGVRFEKIVRFATVDLVKANWLLKHKGVWTVTEVGRKAYEDFKDPEAFYKEACRLYHVWRNKRDAAEGAEDDGASPEGGKRNDANITFEQAEEQAWAAIAAHLKAMHPYEFQELVASLLRAMGYHVAWVAPPGKDRGIDILAWSDPLGTRPPRIKIQVKRHEENIRVQDLRSFLAVLGEDDVGIFVTTGAFTKDAEEEARTQERRKVTLIDLERLFDLWVEYYPKLEEPARRRFPIQPIYFLAPED